MPFNTDTLAQARSQNATDDEIWSDLVSKDDRFRVAKEQGASLDDVASHLSNQGGELTNEGQTYTEGNAQRQADEQGQIGSSQGLQASNVRMQEPNGSEERQRNIDPSKPSTQLRSGIGEGQITGGTIEESTKTEGQRTQEGQKARQGIRGQVPTGNKEEVKKAGGNVPSVASQVIGTITSPFGYIGEEGWKGIAGIARTLGADKVAEYASNTAAKSVEDWATTFGGTPQKEGVGKTIGQVGAFVLEAPIMFAGLGEGAAMAAIGKAGLGGFLAQGYGGMKEDLRDKYLKEGMSEDDANFKSTTHAALNTVAAIPAYILGGKVAGKVADKFIAESSPALLELAGRFGMNGMANMVASSATRGFGAALEGEDIGSAMKDITLSGVLQDFAFAGHSTGEWFHNSLDKAQTARGLPDGMLKWASENSKDRAERVAANGEIKRREAENQAKAAEATDLPETAKVVGIPEETAPEKPKTHGELKQGRKTTLYRGEGGDFMDSESGGQWWTTDKSKAEKYGKVTSVTLDDELVGKHSAKGAKEDEFVFLDEGKRPLDLSSEETAKQTTTPAESKEAPKPEEKAIDPSEPPRLQEAAYIATHPETGEKRIFRGENHDEALYKAKQKGFIEDKAHKKLSGTKNAKNRNTEDFGFLDQHGKFHNREDARWIADEANQLTNGSIKFDHYSPEGKALLHSHEVELEKYPERMHGEVDVDAIHGMTAEDALKHAYSHSSASDAVKSLIKAVLATKSKTLKTDILSKQPAAGVIGEAFRKPGLIGIPMSGKLSLRTLVHEAVHSLTADAIYKYFPPEDAKFTVGSSYLKWIEERASDPSVPQPIKRIASLYKSYLEQVNKKHMANAGTYSKKFGETYGDKNLHEFMAEAFSNKDFQAGLRLLKGDGNKSMLKSLIDAVRQYLRIPEGSMLDNVMDATLAIGKMGTSEKEKDFILYAPNAEKISIEAGIETGKVASQVPEEPTTKKDNAFHKVIEKAGMFQDDLKAMGSEDVKNHIKEAGKGLFSGLRDAYTMVADVLEGKTIPGLTNAGVKLTATQHAQARRMLDPYVKHLISQVFPDLYKMSDEGKREIANIEYNLEKQKDTMARLERPSAKKKYSDNELFRLQNDTGAAIKKLHQDLEGAKNKHDKTRQVMDIINKDNILGGADIIKEEITSATTELEDLRKAYEEGTAERGAKIRIKELEGKIADQTEALAAIEKVHDLEKYGKEVEAAKGTFIEENIQRWRDIVQPAMDELYKKVNNTDTVPETERGRVFGSRVNLLAKHEAMKYMEFEGEPDGPVQPMMGVNYRNPDIKRDMLAKKAAFNSEYSNDVEAILKNSFGQRMNEASKMDFYNDMLEKGIAKWPAEGEVVKEIDGKPVRRMEVEWPVKDEKTGRVRYENKSMYVRADLYNEIAQILDIGVKTEANPILQNVTKLQIIGVADATAHLKNLLSVVTNSLGRDSNLKDVISKIPLVGSANAVREIRSVMKEIQSDSPKIRKELADLARTSGMRPHYEQTGIFAKIPSAHNLLHEVDVASRIIMSRRYKNLVKNRGAVDTPEAKIDFINQIGEYNRRLMSRHEAALRDVGISPFIVAGRAMNRMARRLVTASPGFKTKEAKAHLEARAVQASGLVMATLLPALINLTTTGSMFGRAGTPIGAIDFGPNFDTSDGKKRIFDLFQLVGIRRGLRQLGLNAAFEGIKNGSSLEEIQKNAFNDMFTTSMHPFIGPGVGLGYETLTGKRLDMRAGFSDIFTSRKVGGWMQYVENLRTGLKQQNELLYGLGAGQAIEKGMELAGVPRPVEQNTSETLRDLGLNKDIPIVSPIARAGYTALSTMVSAAGGKLNVSPALKLSAQLGSKQQYDPQQDLRYKYRQEILNAVKAGKKDEAAEIYKKGISDGILTKADDKTLKGQIKQPDLLLQRVSRLKTPEDALSVFRVSTADEQDRIAQTVFKKIKGASAITLQSKQKMFKEFGRVAKKGTKLYNIVNQ